MFKINDVKVEAPYKDILFVVNSKIFSSLGEGFVKQKIVGFLKYFIYKEEIKNLCFRFNSTSENGVPVQIFYKGIDVTYDLINFMKEMKDPDVIEFDNELFVENEYSTFAFTTCLFFGLN